MGALVEIQDRPEMAQALKDYLQVDPRHTAVITVDMKRSYLDPEVGSNPLEPEKARSVVEHTQRLLRIAREAGLPVIHVILISRELPTATRPWNQALEATRHTWSPGARPERGGQRAGSVQVELPRELGPEPGDFVIDTKRRFSCYYGTDLEILLRDLDVDTVVLTGINTNTCVQLAAFESWVRDLKTIVVSDCVGSTYGGDLHVFALQNVQRCIGWVLTVEEFEQKLAAARVTPPRG